ncbi:MAG: hypothetical protein E7623_03485 [Ruminococcaceae bacterium]|nr:hypothetical protein [Oscillospiraceae bacterium]
MLRDNLNGEIINAVKNYIADTGDDKVYSLSVPQADRSMNGSRSHPGVEAHKLYAAAITKKLKEIL